VRTSFKTFHALPSSCSVSVLCVIWYSSYGCHCHVILFLCAPLVCMSSRCWTSWVCHILGDMNCNLMKVVPFRLEQNLYKLMELMWLMENTTYGLVQTMLHYWKMWLKTGMLINVWWKSSILNFNNIFKTVYGKYGNEHLWLYINNTLLWINKAENWNCLATFSDSFPYEILRKSVQWFRRCHHYIDRKPNMTST
jgi:hypothetical protein